MGQSDRGCFKIGQHGYIEDFLVGCVSRQLKSVSEGDSDYAA